MILRDFINNAIRVKEIVNTHEKLFTYLEKINSNFQNYLNFCTGMRNSYAGGNANATQQNITPFINQINDLDKKVIDEISKYEPYDLFTEITSLISSFEEIEIFNTNSKQIIESDIKKLIKLQTQAFSVKKFTEIFSFVSFSDQFLNKLYRYTNTAEIILEKLNIDGSQIPENNKIIEIQVVNSDYNLEVFSSFLSFLDNLYKNLGKVFIIHYSEYPLTIIKVESGSIWTKLFGHEKLIELIKELLLSLGKYIRDLQTGQIDREKFENRVSKAGIILDLIEKAESIGIDEKNHVLLEKVFNQSVVDIAKLIPKSTTEIIVDNKKLLDLDKKETKAIEGRNPLMLNDNNEKNTSA